MRQHFTFKKNSKRAERINAVHSMLLPPLKNKTRSSAHLFDRVIIEPFELRPEITGIVDFQGVKKIDFSFRAAAKQPSCKYGAAKLNDHPAQEFVGWKVIT